MLSILTIIFVVGLAIWSSTKDQMNRFFLASTLVVLFLPYEIFSLSNNISTLSKISPFSLYIIIFYLCILVSGQAKWILSIHKSLLPFLILVGYLVFLTAIKNPGKGFGTIIDNYVAVFLCLNFLVMNKSRISEVDINGFLKLFYLSSILIIFEFFISYNILYFSVFSNAEWAYSQWQFDQYRSTGGIGHPLIVSTLYLMMLPIILYTKLPHKTPLFFITLLTIVATGSRAGVFLALIYSVFLMYKRNTLNVFIVFLLTSVVTAIVFYYFGLFDSIVYRIFNSEGSTAVRLAILNILDDVISIGFFGNGIGSTANFIESVNFYNAIEVSWVSLVVEAGFFGVLLFLFSWFYFLYRNDAFSSNYSVLILSFCMISSFNSIVVHTPILYILPLIALLNKQVRNI